MPKKPFFKNSFKGKERRELLLHRDFVERVKKDLKKVNKGRKKTISETEFYAQLIKKGLLYPRIMKRIFDNYFLIPKDLEEQILNSEILPVNPYLEDLKEKPKKRAFSISARRKMLRNKRK